MDVSKLPRLSKTDTPTNDPDQPGGEQPPGAAVAGAWCPNCGAPLVPGSRFCNACGAALQGAARRVRAGTGVEVWISAILGLLLMLLGRSFGAYLFALMTGAEFHTGVNWVEGEKAGTEVSYWELEGMTGWTDCGLFLFGLALVLEAMVLAVVYTSFRHKAMLVSIALAITVAATALNLYIALMLLMEGFIPLYSMLAVAFGGYIGYFEWVLLQEVRVPFQKRGATPS